MKIISILNPILFLYLRIKSNKYPINIMYARNQSNQLIPDSEYNFLLQICVCSVLFEVIIILFKELVYSSSASSENNWYPCTV